MLVPRSLLLLILLIPASCTREKKAADPAADFAPDAHYFSVAAFITDQYKLNFGSPVLLTQVSTLNGRRDTVLVPVFEADFTPILQAAREADIYDRKYLGRYTFDDVQDVNTGTRGFVYEANEAALNTRMLSITVDGFEHNRVLSFYLHWKKVSGRNNLSRWFYFEPGKYLRYIEEEHPQFGDARALKVEYFWNAEWA